ncbi:MAG: nucleotidyltransferase domain-containing protein [Candidatus Nezhaarchaeota archaeon]|nr:nucleotidyltransferase domain-containing protein [Candidatus Nezhaarchaeota archaeon]
MPAAKPILRGDAVEVVYEPWRWSLLEELRSKAAKVMKILEEGGMEVIVHGSVARGDVSPRSDVDVVIPYPVQSFKVEVVLTSHGLTPVEKIMTMATPTHAIKAHIYLDEKTCVTFPLVELTKLEREFYRFGGEVGLRGLASEARVAGVDKRLMLISPTRRGHVESPVIGREEEVARILGVSVDIVKERVQVLTKRDEVGRTGIYLKRRLAADECFEEVLAKLRDVDPAVRRLLVSRSSLV